ncbi:hypothetical protein ABT247_18785 [Kitasatospora sp. NPDC001539]|uniref:hypothetical protein n=1 Tax=Kitasatospora sp. NPDC001539 TaxID=3154384 RepID=UPI0033285437
MRHNDPGSSLSGADLELAEALKCWSGKLRDVGLLQRDQAERLGWSEEKYSKFLNGRLRITAPRQMLPGFLAMVAEKLGEPSEAAARADLEKLAQAAHAARPLAWVADELARLRAEIAQVRDDRAAAEVQRRLAAAVEALARTEATLAGHGEQLAEDQWELGALRWEVAELRARAASAVSVRYRAGRDVNAPVTYYNGPGSGPERRITPARAVGGAALALALVAAVVVGRHWYGSRTAVDDAALQRQAEKSVDQRTVPFQVLVDGPDLRRHGVWTFVLDRPLTRAEQAGLARFKPDDLARVRAYLEPLGARLLPEGDPPKVWADTRDPALKAIENWEKQGMVGGDTYRLHFTSDRSSSVTVENIGITDVSCSPSRAVSSVRAPSAGQSGVPNVFLSAALPPGTPAVELDDQGGAVNTDYFAHHKLDLGQATTPGDIAVQVGGVAGQVCSWAFQVDYLTPEGKFTARVDDRGKPFTVEALPAHLAQRTLYDLGGASHPAHWADCAAEPTLCGPV